MPPPKSIKTDELADLQVATRGNAIRIALWYDFFGILWVVATGWLIHSLVVGNDELEARWEAVKNAVFVLGSGAVLWWLLRINFQRIRTVLQKLRDSEERLRAVGDNLPNGYVYEFVRRQDGSVAFTYVSAGAERVHGVSVKAILGDAGTLLNQQSPEQREAFHAAMARSMATLGDFDMELEAPGPGGTRCWIQVRSHPRQLPNGDFLWHGVVMDITESVQQRNRLRESQDRLNEAQSLARLGSWNLNLTNHQLEWSPEVFAIFELSPERFRASYEAFLGAIHPEDRERVNQVYQDSVQNRTPYEVDHRLLLPDGRIKYVQERGRTEYAADGRALRSLGTIQDVTERQRLVNALLESEEQFRAVVEGAVAAVLIVVDWVIVYANPAALRLFGAKGPHELLGLSALSLIHPDYHELVRARGSQVLGGARTVAPPMDEVYLRLDGTPVSVEVAAVPVMYKGREAGVVFVRDITERKEAERRLRESEVQYRGLVETAFDWIWEVDTQGRYTYVSPKVEQFLGYHPEEVLGRTPFDLMPEAEAERVGRLFAEIVARREPFSNLENINLHKSGRLVILESNGMPVLGPDGEIKGYRGMDRDVTQRKHAEAKWQSYIQNAPVGILVADEHGQHVEANRAIERIFGYGNGELLLTKVQDFRTPENDRDINRLFAEVATDGHAARDVCFQRKDGARVWCHVRATRLETKHVLGIFQNVTEQRLAEQALQESERNFRAMFEVASIGLAQANPQTGEFLRVNPKLCEITDYSDIELLEKGVRDITHPEDRAKDWELFQDVIQGRRAEYRVEKRYVRRDGSVVWARVNMSLVRDEAGQPLRTVAAIEDITEIKQAELALRENLLFRRAAEKLSLIGAWKANPETDFLRCTEGVYDIMEMPLEYEPGLREALGFFAPEFVPLIEAGLRQAHQEGAAFSVEAIINTRTGKRLWVEVRGLGRIKVGEDDCVMGTMQDITARKVAEEERMRLSTALEQAAESIVITDLQGRITYVNPAFERITGYSREESVGQNPRSLKSGQQDLAFYKNLWSTIKSGQVWQGRFVNKRKNGTLFVEDATITPVRDKTGRVVSFMAIKLDVSHEAELQTQIRQTQKLEAIGQLAGGVAHDFNNILTSIIMQVELGLMDDVPAGEAREGLVQIRSDAERAASLTRQLLLFSRRQIMQSRQLDLNEVVTNLAKMLQRIIGEDVRLHLTLHPHALLTQADAGMLDQILMNLAVNARDAMPEGGHLTIETMEKEVREAAAELHPDARPGRYVCLSVTDTGTGIPPEVLPRIFEPFFTTKEAGKGTGLGLATVFGIVKQHRGWIQVRNEPESGASFHVFLPATLATTQAGAEESHKAPPKGGTETILLVEDDASLRRATHTILSRQGYDVIEASSGAEALRLWESLDRPVALLFTDLVMPGGLSGQQLAESLVARNPQLRVVYSSGYSPEIAGREIRLRPGEQFLQKPFKSNSLLECVRKCLDS